jgi:hypothetical protein
MSAIIIHLTLDGLYKLNKGESITIKKTPDVVQIFPPDPPKIHENEEPQFKLSLVDEDLQNLEKERKADFRPKRFRD